jgi:hypothetical protein
VEAAEGSAVDVRSAAAGSAGGNGLPGFALALRPVRAGEDLVAAVVVLVFLAWVGVVVGWAAVVVVLVFLAWVGVVVGWAAVVVVFACRALGRGSAASGVVPRAAAAFFATRVRRGSAASGLASATASTVASDG